MRLLITDILRGSDGEILFLQAKINAPLGSIDVSQHINTNIDTRLYTINYNIVEFKGSLTIGRIRSGFESNAFVKYDAVRTWIDVEYNKYKTGSYINLLSHVIEHRMATTAIP